MVLKVKSIVLEASNLHFTTTSKYLSSQLLKIYHHNNLLMNCRLKSIYKTTEFFMKKLIVCKYI